MYHVANLTLDVEHGGWDVNSILDGLLRAVQVEGEGSHPADAQPRAKNFPLPFNVANFLFKIVF